MVFLSQAGFSQVDERLLKGMQYRLIGPFRGGRVLAVASVSGDPQTYYFGAATGGVWKSIDGGANWNPIFDKEAVSSIGSIAVAPSDPNVVYAGTGEGCLRGNISYGDGIYRSNDAGKTWKNVGLRDSRHIPKVLVDPRNPDVVLVAAMGHAFAPNAERGVFRSADGGKTWDKVLYVDDRTGATDIAFAPGNRRSFLQPCTKPGGSHGHLPVAAPVAASIVRQMAVSLGSVWKAMACPKGSWAESASPFPALIPTVSLP
jgi:photosystem II stability/assembly factor-like uncharacterized protein